MRRRMPPLDTDSLLYAMRKAGVEGKPARLAQMAGLSAPCVRELCSGRVTRPRPATVETIARALGVEPWDLCRYPLEWDGATGARR